MISPTVGRIVWFYHSSSQKEPNAAIVAKVWSDRMVNLSVVNDDGTHKPVTSVNLVQEEDSTPETGPFCTWMPYQIGQSKKA